MAIGRRNSSTDYVDCSRSGGPAAHTYIRDLFPTGHSLAPQQFNAFSAIQEASGWENELQGSPTPNFTFFSDTRSPRWSSPKTRYNAEGVRYRELGYYMTFGIKGKA